MRRLLTGAAIVTLFCPNHALATAQTIPPHSSMIDVTAPPYNAKGDGVTDDTLAIQQAISDYASWIDTTGNLVTDLRQAGAILYFPAGTYLVSNSLQWQTASGHWGAYLSFQGHDSADTLIQLTDHASGFSDPSHPKAVIYTASAQALPGTTDGSGNTAFANNIWNLTVNTGHGNPGAEGINWMASNIASLRDVLVVAGDGQGVAGIDLSRIYGGPDFIKNVTITGFNYGVYINSGDWASTTFEHLTVQNQKFAGLELDNNAIAIHDLTSINAVPAIHLHGWGSLLTLIGGQLQGGSTGRSAIEADTNQLPAPNYYIRDVNAASSAYASVLSSGAIVSNTATYGASGYLPAGNTPTRWPGLSIVETTSLPALSLFPSPATSFQLPIQETPQFDDPNLTHWANVESFGAVPDTATIPIDQTGHEIDDTAAIQAALDSGAKVVYFPHGWYPISAPLHIHGSVQKLIGYGVDIVPFNAASNGLSPVLSVDANAAGLVVIEDIAFGSTNWLANDGSRPSFGYPFIKNASPGTLVLSDVAQATYSNLSGAGPLFLEDVEVAGANDPAFTFNQEQVWMRQYDPEAGLGLSKTQVNGGTAWILGMKTEGYTDSALSLSGGASVELLGARFLANGSPTFSNGAAAQPLIVSQDSQLSLVYQTADNWGNPDWPVQVQETRGGVTRRLPNQNNYGGISVVPLYTGYSAALLHQPPIPSTQTVTVAVNASTGIVLSAVDPNGFPITYAIATPPANGTLTGSPPHLTYTPAPGYLGIDSFTFTASNGFSTSASTSVSINVTSWYGATWHGSAFRNVKDFGAKGDGTTDDTAAIQAAINWDQSTQSPLYKSEIVVYFPPGTYRISNSIVIWTYTQLMGDEDAPPTLVLPANSPGFSDPTHKKPLLVTAMGTGIDPATFDWQSNSNSSPPMDATNNTFWTQIHNFNIQLQPGNPGAVGILWKVAQATSIRNVRIVAADAAVGIDVGGVADYAPEFTGKSYIPDEAGGGTIEDVFITGGGIGLRFATSAMWTFRSLRIQNQTAFGMWGLGDDTINMVDVRISGVPTGITAGYVAHLAILDSNIQASMTPFAANGYDPVTNVPQYGYYVENTPGITPPGGAVWGGTYKAYANGIGVSSGTIPMTRTMPMMLRSRPKLYPANGSIINVHDLGAHGDGVTDDTALLQQAINQYDTVFLPYGNYLVSRTLLLRPTSRIFGEGVTSITLAANAPGFSNINQPQPLMLAPDNAGATVELANFNLATNPGNPGVTLLKWGAGSASGVWDVSEYDNYDSAIHLNLFGHGGGVFSNVWGPGYETAHPGAIAGFLGNSTGPAWFYGVAFEHMPSHAFQISGASDYYFMTPQTEDTPTAFEVDQSSRIWVYGLYGADWVAPSDLLKISGSDAVFFNSIGLANLQNLCITMPSSIGGPCQSISGASLAYPVIGSNPPHSWLSLLEFEKPPVAGAPAITTVVDTSTSVILSASNPNGMPISYSTVTTPSNGTLTGIAPHLIYTPNANFVGQDTFTFTASDGFATSSATFVTITVSLASMPPADPDLSSIDGKTFTASDTLSIPYSGTITGFNWVFEPDTLAATASLSPRLAALPQESPAPVFTPSPSLKVNGLGLTGGRYIVLVQAVNGSQTSNWVTAHIMLVLSVDLSAVRMYPNPFRSARGDSQITFDQMPAGSTVKIFTVSARLAKTLSAPAGIVSWDLTNDSGDKVASGIYLYLITDDSGNKARGKLTIIR